jgi:hypothetical protein
MVHDNDGIMVNPMHVHLALLAIADNLERAPERQTQLLESQLEPAMTDDDVIAAWIFAGLALAYEFAPTSAHIRNLARRIWSNRQQSLFN